MAILLSPHQGPASLESMPRKMLRDCLLVSVSEPSPRNHVGLSTSTSMRLRSSAEVVSGLLPALDQRRDKADQTKRTVWQGQWEVQLSQLKKEQTWNKGYHNACEMVMNMKTFPTFGAVVDTLQIRSKLIRRRVAAGTTSVTVINQTAQGRSSGDQRK